MLLALPTMNGVGLPLWKQGGPYYSKGRRMKVITLIITDSMSPGLGTEACRAEGRGRIWGWKNHVGNRLNAPEQPLALLF